MLRPVNKKCRTAMRRTGRTCGVLRSMMQIVMTLLPSKSAAPPPAFPFVTDPGRIASSRRSSRPPTKPMFIAKDWGRGMRPKEPLVGRRRPPPHPIPTRRIGVDESCLKSSTL